MKDLRQQLAELLQGRVCLMGLGNVDCGDDGFGVRLAEDLLKAGVPDVVIALLEDAVTVGAGLFVVTRF